jgi:hypothetical protein
VGEMAREGKRRKFISVEIKLPPDADELMAKRLGSTLAYAVTSPNDDISNASLAVN